MKIQYSAAFGRNPRGQKASDPAWLRQKLSEKRLDSCGDVPMFEPVSDTSDPALIHIVGANAIRHQWIRAGYDPRIGFDMAILGYPVEHFYDALTADSNIVSWEQLLNTVKAYSEYTLADWANRKTLLQR